jgi:aldose sugar dehydrogenase
MLEDVAALRRPSVAGLCAAAVLLLPACAGGDGFAAPRGGTSPAPTTAPDEAPRLEVSVLAEGFDHPWDVVQAPDGTLLVDERGGGLTAVRVGGGRQEVSADFGDLFATGETGLMGLALSPAFADDRRFFTCQGVDGERREIQVVEWTMAPDWTAAEREGPLVAGIPVNGDTGRHGGCRLVFGPDGALYVGTGDNAVGENPQERGSLAGKVLRVDPATGKGLPDNPFADAGDGAAQRLWTLGHRNVQGLAVRPGDEQVYAVEHGPDRDDEVNLLQPGANYGWDPAGGGYDESVPMTDPRLRGAVAAVWTSGTPTIAPSGATFVEGQEWGLYDGLLLVGVLKDTGVLALRLADDGTVVEQFRLPELEDRYGRIRAVRQGGDGALYVTTDNGGGGDVLLRVLPVRR